MKAFTIFSVLLLAAVAAAVQVPEQKAAPEPAEAGAKSKRGISLLGYGHSAPLISHHSYVAAPAPIISHAPIVHHAPIISHAPLLSSSSYHVSHVSHAPIYSHAPSYSVHHAPLISHAPIISHAPLISHHAPLLSYHHSSPLLSTFHRR